MDRSRVFLFYLHLLEKAEDFEEACVILRCASRDSELGVCDFYALRYRFDSIYSLGGLFHDY